jgi:hypothetical protein
VAGDSGVKEGPVHEADGHCSKQDLNELLVADLVGARAHAAVADRRPGGVDARGARHDVQAQAVVSRAFW